MVKFHKLLTALLIITISAIIIPVLASESDSILINRRPYRSQEMCDKCKANPESCKLMAGGKCDNPEGCQDDTKTIEKKIVVLSSDENRGYLGIYTEVKDGGVVIEKVIPESPAAKAGMTNGMIITSVKGTKIKTREELINVLKNTKPKDTVSVIVRYGHNKLESDSDVKSGGKEKTIKVVLGEVPKTEMKEMKIKVKCEECEDEDEDMPKQKCKVKSVK